MRCVAKQKNISCGFRSDFGILKFFFFLQPQLNKAVGKAETFTKGDVNLKDWIVFFQTDFSVVNGSTTRDNTGKVMRALRY